MAYADQYNLFADATNDLHKIVARAIDVAARDVINESDDTASHAERFKWACATRQHPDKIIDAAHRWVPRILDNATIAAAGNSATDSDVQFVVNGLVNTMAGV